jgi:hypothetical protein
MPTSVSAGGVHGLGDNDDEASLWEVLMVLGVVASRFFLRRKVFAPQFFVMLSLAPIIETLDLDRFGGVENGFSMLFCGGFEKFLQNVCIRSAPFATLHVMYLLGFLPQEIFREAGRVPRRNIAEFQEANL